MIFNIKKPNLEQTYGNENIITKWKTKYPCCSKCIIKVWFSCVCWRKQKIAFNIWMALSCYYLWLFSKILFMSVYQFDYIIRLYGWKCTVVCIRNGIIWWVYALHACSQYKLYYTIRRQWKICIWKLVLLDTCVCYHMYDGSKNRKI